MYYKIPISIIMPCYNCEKFVAQAIASILTQSFTKFEFIIINDGSTDNTSNEIEKFSDSRIRYFSFTDNIGNYKCRNFGFKKSLGKYICVMDADDIALPERLYLQRLYLESHKYIGCISGGCEFIDSNGALLGKMIPVNNTALTKVRLLQNNSMIHPAVMMRTSLLKKSGLHYNEDYLYASDYDLMSKLSKITNITNLATPLIQYRRHENQISTSKYSEQKRHADIIRISMLEQLGVEATVGEKSLHLKLMCLEPLSQGELLEAEIWLNGLLDANETLRIYSRFKLFKMFSSMLFFSFQNCKTS